MMNTDQNYTLDLTPEQRQLLQLRLIEFGNFTAAAGRRVGGVVADIRSDSAHEATALAGELNAGRSSFTHRQMAAIRRTIATARTAEDGSDELYGQGVDLGSLAEQLNTRAGDGGPSIPPAPPTYWVEFTPEQRQTAGRALDNAVSGSNPISNPDGAREDARRRRTVRRLDAGATSFSSGELELMMDALAHVGEDPLLDQPAQRPAQEAADTVRRVYDDTDRPLYLTAVERTQLATVLSNAREDRYERADDEERSQELHGSVERAAELRRSAPVFDALAGDVRAGRTEFDRVEFGWIDQALAGEQGRTGLDAVRTQVHAGAAEHRPFPWGEHAGDTPRLTEMPDFFTVYPYERVPLVQALQEYQRYLTEPGAGDNMFALADHFDDLTTQVDHGQNAFTRQDLHDISDALDVYDEALPLALQPLQQRLTTAQQARARQPQRPDPMKAAFTPLTHSGTQQRDSATRPTTPPPGTAITRSHHAR